MSESFLRNVQNDDNSEEKDSSLGCLSQKNAKFMHPKRVNHTYTNRGAPHDTFLAKKLEYVLTIMIAGNVQTRAIGIF